MYIPFHPLFIVAFGISVSQFVRIPESQRTISVALFPDFHLTQRFHHTCHTDMVFVQFDKYIIFHQEKEMEAASDIALTSFQEKEIKNDIKASCLLTDRCGLE
ncbi:MAG: hypothetical protein MJ001_01720 [Paludibacteraceae bacterium]|nr:hypothetical protein [Paludibacteraceae bacterium]